MTRTNATPPPGAVSPLDLVATARALRAAPPVLVQHRTTPAAFDVTPRGATEVVLAGYASMTGRGYAMHDAAGAYTETVARGAFTTTLADTPDVAFLLNHGGLTMARTRAGTLTLREDSAGLHTEARLDSRRGDVRDLLAAIERQDVDQMSFGFRITEQAWSDDLAERTIAAVDLHRGDVSAVNYGANPFTSIGLRGVGDADTVVRDARAAGIPANSVVGQLTHVLALLATIDQAADLAQPILAQVLGVPNPDEDDTPPAAPASGQAPTAADADLSPAPRAAADPDATTREAWAALEVLRLRHAHDARPRR